MTLLRVKTTTLLHESQILNIHNFLYGYLSLPKKFSR